MTDLQIQHEIIDFLVDVAHVLAKGLKWKDAVLAVGQGLPLKFLLRFQALGSPNDMYSIAELWNMEYKALDDEEKVKLLQSLSKAGYKGTSCQKCHGKGYHPPPLQSFVFVHTAGGLCRPLGRAIVFEPDSTNY